MKATVKQNPEAPVVYVGGRRIIVKKPDATAGEFLPDTYPADLIVKRPTNGAGNGVPKTDFLVNVPPTYKLQPGEELVVAPRGVAG